MYLTELNRSFSDLDRKVIYYINQIKNQMYTQAREHALLTSKYKLGFEFSHPNYGLGFIKDIEISLNKDDYMSFETDMIMPEDYYKPFYMYIVDYYKRKDVCGHHVTESEISSWISNKEVIS